MWRALIYKELRELAIWIPIASGIALLLLFSGVFSTWLSMTFGEKKIPFYSADAPMSVGIFGVIAACLFGLSQTVGESLRGTWLLLLHRRMSRRHVIASKLIAGITALLFVTVLPTLTYAIWAATPGTHASPFYWSMTDSTWIVILGLISVYLTAFLSGLRDAAWFGSRLLPLLGGLLLFSILQVLQEPLSWPWHLLITFVVIAALVLAILHLADSREFST